MVTETNNKSIPKGIILNSREYFETKSSYSSDTFKAQTGGILIKNLLQSLDIKMLVENLRKENPSRRINKRLSIASALEESKENPLSMVLEVILVLPPDLRPLLFMDDGTVASSDLNELYIRLLHRNNRLKKLLSLKAPEILLNTERQALQGAVDALIDNGRRSAIKTRTGNRLLKSLTSLISGKEGRMRRNLLGKRVDYSGRSVITVGPNLKLHQCGLPLELAMNILKPFVYGILLRKRYVQTLKQAKVLVEKNHVTAIDALEQTLQEKVVLLNRAPTLHRLVYCVINNLTFGFFHI
jgi:DNA-directed RNA polymerase subunit beta'